MKLLHTADHYVTDALGDTEAPPHGTPLRPSLYAVPIDTGKRRVVFHTLTRASIDAEELHDWFLHPSARPYDAADGTLQELYENRFLVEESKDEVQMYVRLIEVLRLLAPKPKKGHTSYTILPTTACNARCFYCYEHGVQFRTMDDEMIAKTVEFILATKREDRIAINWFGGEPLYGAAAIDKICAALRENGIKYMSEMTTNASLFNEATVRKAVADWHLAKVQVTLDGREEEYLRRKRYLPPFPGSPYQAVLQALQRLQQNRVQVSVRLNADLNNLDELHALVDELAEKFPDKRGISVYVSDLYLPKQYNSDSPEGRDKICRLYEGINRLSDHIEEVHFSGGDYPKRLRTYRCMADLPEGAPVISPDGTLGCCEHINETPVLGSILDPAQWDMRKREEFVRHDRPQLPKCRACPFLPECVDFSSCPVKEADCQQKVYGQLRRALKAIDNPPLPRPTNEEEEDTIQGSCT